MTTRIQMEGPLFETVQGAGIFKDSKTFVDAVPVGEPGEILARFEQRKAQAEFDLKSFVLENFELPQPVEVSESLALETSSLTAYIDSLWARLRREPEDVAPGSTLIPLEYPYIVPGGRFGEIYYWDSYFTFLGLVEAGHLGMVENMVRNFVYLQETLALIPNGNRHYFATRSQPPLLSLMVALLWRKRYQYKEDGLKQLEPYLSALEREHAFWMKPERVTALDDTLLNHYWDTATTPRQEAYLEDASLAERHPAPEQLYRHLRAGAESGWDFSSRWLSDAGDLATIHTADILPVDLNCLLYALESTLAEFYGKVGDTERLERYGSDAERRKQAINHDFWSESKGFYFDYDVSAQAQTDVYSLAGAFPLFLELAGEEQARAVKDILMTKFLQPGGLVTTLHQTGQQWDSPNGWAPLQWVAIQGLRNYGFDAEAKEIGARWLNMIRDRFAVDKKLLEKYDVVNLERRAGGGEYEVQEGFGWTNGVTLKLLKLYG